MKKICHKCKAISGLICRLGFRNTVNLNPMEQCPKPLTKKRFRTLFYEKFNKLPTCKGCKSMRIDNMTSACLKGYAITFITGGDWHGGIDDIRPVENCKN